MAANGKDMDVPTNATAGAPMDEECDVEDSGELQDYLEGLNVFLARLGRRYRSQYRGYREPHA
jgi:hypothetical protein